MLLNCDLGEGVGNDADIIPFIDQANIACAAHAGSIEEMYTCLNLCKQFEVEVAAHVGFADREHFGRRALDLNAEAIYDLCMQQTQLLIDCAAEHQQCVSYVKPHGALYNMMMRDAAILKTLMTAVRDINHKHRADLKFMLMALPDNTASESLAQELGVHIIFEAFADRAYDEHGFLVSRSQAHACHESIDVICEQAHALRLGRHAVGDLLVAQGAQSICIHGDAAGATEFAAALRSLLSE